MWVLFLALLLPGTAFAAAPDYSGLVSSIDVSGVIAGILSAAAIFIGVIVVRKGAELILDFFDYRASQREAYEDWIAASNDDDYWDGLKPGTNARDDIF